MIAAATVYCLVALLMLFAILLQEAKGGGLSALGGTRAESAFGASNPLRKLTVWLSIIFFVLASVLYIVMSKPPVIEDDEDAAPAAAKQPEGGAEQGAKQPTSGEPVVEEVGVPGGTDAGDGGQDATPEPAAGEPAAEPAAPAGPGDGE
jgi:protein translocase SecG subunit